MKNSKYKDVTIYAYMEHMNYHRLSDDGEVSDDIAEYDFDPQIQCWNLYGCDGMIEVTLDYKDYPKISDVYKYIDNELKEINKVDKSAIMTSISTLLVQAENGYYLSEFDIKRAENAVDTLQQIIMKAKRN